MDSFQPFITRWRIVIYWITKYRIHCTTFLIRMTIRSSRIIVLIKWITFYPYKCNDSRAFQNNSMGTLFHEILSTWNLNIHHMCSCCRNVATQLYIELSNIKHLKAYVPYLYFVYLKVNDISKQSDLVSKIVKYSSQSTLTATILVY